jgi:hypothetical protein
MKTKYVYFFQAEESGVIKIGFSRSPAQRLKHLQIGHHEKLAMLGYAAGTSNDERKLHKRLVADKLSGEWFKPTKPVLEAVVGFLNWRRKPSNLKLTQRRLVERWLHRVSIYLPLPNKPGTIIRHPPNSTARQSLLPPSRDVRPLLRQRLLMLPSLRTPK